MTKKQCDAIMEIWKPSIVEGISVSNYGNVKRDRDGFLYKKQTNKSNGYNYVDLRWMKGKMMKVSRLVALAFIPNPHNKKIVDHINTIRTDDRVENLRWCTASENMKNSVTLEKIRLSAKRDKPYRRKAILQYDLDGNFLQTWDSATSFGKAINKDVNGNIIACIKGKQPSAYGYKWKYKNEHDDN